MTLTVEWHDAHAIALKGDRKVGRVEIICEEPVIAYLVNPRAEEGEDAVGVSKALLSAGAAEALRRGCARVEVILEDRLPHIDALVAAMSGWGHPLIRTKLLFSRGIEDLPRLPDEGLSFSRVEGPKDPRLLTVLRDTFDDGATEGREGQTAEELIEELVNLFVAVVPKARGRGHGLRLNLRGVSTMVRRGAERLLGSCEADNEPMARIFVRLGYEQKFVQRYLEWREEG